MNALPGSLLVDTGATDRDRAAAVWALSHMVATRYFPRHAEASKSLARQLAFTAWHGSERATQRGGQDDGVCGLFGLGCALVEQVIADLRSQRDPVALARFCQVTGLEHDAVLEIPAPALLQLTMSNDLLAASLAVEAYRRFGPLPGNPNPRRCAQTWISRMLTIRGPLREANENAWARGFSTSAEELLELLD
jgi:hypothetical protein